MLHNRSCLRIYLASAIKTGRDALTYVLLQKTLPEVGLYLTSVRYDSSVFPPQGRWVLSSYTRHLSFIAPES